MTSELNITPEALLNIYRQGSFPMADSATDDAFYIVEPKIRGMIPIKDFHISKSLVKTLKKDDFDIKFNENFEDVINACQARTNEKASETETWINDTIKSLFIELHKQGHAYCIEVWRDDALIGGLYGLALGDVFCGESMFSHASNGSKIALVFLSAILDATGFELLDAQFMNDHLLQFGAYEMPQADYLAHLEKNKDKKNTLNTIEGDIVYELLTDYLKNR